MESINRRSVDVGIASRVLSGERECGDLSLVQRFDNGFLVAVVDGIGHGEEAAKVALMTVSILRGHAEDPIRSLVQRCHEGLRATRGAVVALASFNTASHEMTWTGVGNIEGKFYSKTKGPTPDTLLSAPGTLGQGQVDVHPQHLNVQNGDTLIFATDGIRPDFYLQVNINQSAAQIAEQILKDSGVESDDALVVVARYAGMRS